MPRIAIGLILAKASQPGISPSIPARKPARSEAIAGKWHSREKEGPGIPMMSSQYRSQKPVSRLYKLRQSVFSEGSDARIAGVSMHSNPYTSGVESMAWLDGWLDADLNWGKHVNGRWYVRPLPVPA